MSAKRLLTAVRHGLAVRGRPVRLRVAAALTICAAGVAAVAAHGAGDPSTGLPPPPPPPVPGSPVAGTLTVDRSGVLTVPSSFFGLSTEYWTLPVDERNVGLYDRVISLLRVPGDAPFVLRIGGDSSDHTFYDPARRHMPAWAFALTSAFVQRTARIVHSMGLHVILDLNLVTGTPHLAAAWAREAEAALPRASIVGFEVGNEPDLYERAIWLRMTGEPLSTPLLPHDITAAGYARDFGRYSHALASIAPQVPLLGPALSHPRVDSFWIKTLLRQPHPGLREISVHEYPYSACAFPGAPSYPTVARILSQRASTGLAASVAPAVVLARRAGLPVRVTEFNSVTCGGTRGVSDTFATALWAPDAGFELMRVGAQSIDLHARQSTVNAPFTFSGDDLVVHPLLYGLIMFVRTLSPHAHLLRSQLHVGAHANVKAWAVASPKGTLSVLVLDKSPRGVHLSLNLPATGAASVQRLLAPSARANSGVTLAGQWLDRDGAWRGRRTIQTVRPRRRRYHLWLPRDSAALLTVRIAPAPIGL